MSVVFGGKGEQNFASFVGFGGISEGGLSGFSCFVFFVEQEDGGVGLLEYSWDGSFVEWHQSGVRVVVQEGFKVGEVEGSGEVVLAFIEFFEKGQGMSGDSSFGFGGEDVGEGEGVVLHGDGSESGPFGVGFGISEIHNGDFVLFLEFLQLILALQFSRDGSGSLGDPRFDLWGFSTSVIFYGFSVNEKFQTGVSRNSKSLGQFGFYGGIDFGEFSAGAFLFSFLGGLGEFWGQGFAVTAPGSVEFDEDEFVFFDVIVEVSGGQDRDVVFDGDAGCGEADQT